MREDGQRPRAPPSPAAGDGILAPAALWDPGRRPPRAGPGRGLEPLRLALQRVAAAAASAGSRIVAGVDQRALARHRLLRTPRLVRGRRSVPRFLVRG